MVRNLREGLPQGQNALRERTAPEINVCCHGQDAGDEVGHHGHFALTMMMSVPGCHFYICLLVCTLLKQVQHLQHIAVWASGLSRQISLWSPLRRTLSS